MKRLAGQMADAVSSPMKERPKPEGEPESQDRRRRRHSEEEAGGAGPSSRSKKERESTVLKQLGDLQAELRESLDPLLDMRRALKSVEESAAAQQQQAGVWHAELVRSLDATVKEERAERARLLEAKLTAEARVRELERRLATVGEEHRAQLERARGEGRAGGGEAKSAEGDEEDGVAMLARMEHEVVAEYQTRKSLDDAIERARREGEERALTSQATELYEARAPLT